MDTTNQSLPDGGCQCLSALCPEAGKKGRTQAEVIGWLTGYRQQALQQHINRETDFETFFAQAPLINPNVSKITGVICGCRVEEIKDQLMQQIRYLDKLVDELANGCPTHPKKPEKLTTDWCTLPDQLPRRNN